ncbi:MAG: hypothetical protein ACREVL_17265 [Solimonas sp.]
MTNKNWLMPLLAAVALPLAACSRTDQHFEDRDVPVETMPVDGHTLGFWIMQTGPCAGVAALCVNDNSPYGDDLVLEDANLQPLAQRDLKRGDSDIGGQVIQLNADDETVPAQLRTPDNSVFANTPVGDVFAIHLRLKPAAGDTPQTVLSLGTGVFNIEASRNSLVVEFPAQDKRLLLPLDGSGDWTELYVASDGQTVSLKLDCQPIAGFSKAAGTPMLSRGATPLMLGARPTAPTSEHFSGLLDLLRVSDTNEADLFCS